MTVYSFRQNNSGGFYCLPAQSIIVVDAKGYSDALETAEKAGLYLNGVAAGSDCECCGDRWNAYVEEFPTVEEAKANAEMSASSFSDAMVPAYLVTDDLDWD